MWVSKTTTTVNTSLTIAVGVDRYGSDRVDRYPTEGDDGVD